MTPQQDLPHVHVADTLDHMLEHEDPKHVALPDFIDNLIRAIGHIICWANGLLVAVIIAQVTLRYGFSNGKIVLEELQWHLYAVGVMFGLSYAQVNDNHIRVDIIHSRLSDRAKRIIEVIGILLFVLPFIYVVFYHSLDFVADAWRTGESSDAPDGLPYRWLIKAVIPASFALLGLASLSRLIRDLYLLVKRK